MPSKTVAERLELIREVLTKIAARESSRMDACPHCRPGREDHISATRKVVTLSKEIAEALVSYRTMTPAFAAWSDVELSAALALVGGTFTDRMSFRSSTDFDMISEAPGQIVELLESFRHGKLRDFACLTWSCRSWNIELTQPDALVALALGD